MSDLAGNPEDRFSHNKAHIHISGQFVSAYLFVNFQKDVINDPLFNIPTACANVSISVANISFAYVFVVVVACFLFIYFFFLLFLHESIRQY